MVQTNNSNGISPFYTAVMQEILQIIDADNLKDQDNIILELEFNLFSMKKNNKSSLTELDEQMKKSIIKQIQELEKQITAKVREYTAISKNESDLQYLYISVQKMTKLACQEKFGDKIKILKIFYARYLELNEWTLMVDKIK